MNQLVPILMYHRCPAYFEAHLIGIKAAGFTLVHLRDIADYLVTQVPDKFPTNKIVLTFDDAFQEIYAQVPRLLEQYGFQGQATICVPIGYVSDNEACRRTWEGISTMSWDELRVLQSEGFEIIPHSVGHPNLNTIADNPGRLLDEIRGSKAVLNHHLDLDFDDTRFFCLPYGGGWKPGLSAYDQRVNTVFRNEGYSGVLRAEYQDTQPWDQFCIPRWDAERQPSIEDLIAEIARQDALLSERKI